MVVDYVEPHEVAHWWPMAVAAAVSVYWWKYTMDCGVWNVVSVVTWAWFILLE